MRTIELLMIQGEGHDGDHSATVQTIPTTVKVDKIRNVHPRKYERPGTRVIFENASAILVANLYEDVKAAWIGDGADHLVVAAPPVAEAPTATLTADERAEDGEFGEDQ